MPYTTIAYTERLAETLARLEDPGVLLVSTGRTGRPNAMVIGWGLVGPVWGKPVFTVLVRPSRYTFHLIEESQAFTVCVPRPDQRGLVDFCGSRSGRDVDKFQELGLEVLPSECVAVPGVAGMPLIYECRVVHANDLLPDRLVPGIKQDFYGAGDYHRVYYGEIMVVRALQ